MYNNNWRPNQGTEPNMDNGDWRGQLQPESCQRIVNRIMDMSNRRFPVSGQEGLHELRNIAQRFEEQIFNAATSQNDYIRRISLRMLAMEAEPQGDLGQPSNQFGSDNEPANPVDANPRMQSGGSRRSPSWTRDYHMG